ncbi:MAG TPA: type II toxin-antitoxin system prevent-host-death family antitoxin [Terracidiphilus sp.]|jgi:prevent-host-death family protein|nr:type II toxin-antitoxin system prevent-host-death family antitoxin [Terracidiphilus sp.]
MSSPAFDITTSLSDLVETTLKDGPQVVAKDGVETAVLVSFDDWKQVRAGKPLRLPGEAAARSLKDILLDPNGPHDIYIPPRGRYRRRKPVELE